MVKREQSERVAIGVLGKPYGLRGEMRVRLFDPSSPVLALVDQIFLIPTREADALVKDVLQVRQQGKDVLLTLAGVRGRGGAASLTGASIEVPRDALPETESDEFYDVDLMGLTVRDESAQQIGVVVGIEHPPASDVIVIKLENREGYLDLPFIDEVVLSVDINESVLVVSIPEGMPTRPKR